ncbi:hypothetical protein [Metabacillus fastidiosus]|uniref:Lipoprotein n=1 Tax=Metabacillus fastidiosus TaxID=1458 RepID=A0ABU6P414_9BACI|nr:hypothetical protein [Metabacillus fastidiosus]MED4404092.1 hypothetical protein [Metabacillus fastidiosus]
MKKNTFSWKRAILLLSLGSIFTISACSSEEETAQQVDEQTVNQIKDFTTKFDESLGQANKQLNTFNVALDGLYTGQVSSEQFVKILSGNIENSRSLISTVESYSVNPKVSIYHQNLLKYLNQQHQLFLDSVEMANLEQIDKRSLREAYFQVKNNQNEVRNIFINGENKAI